jgi:hypothetical protein
MEQHPIPQQISSYEFKLVGDMTLKQFIKAAAGILLAVLINTTKIVVIIKWPLMAVSAGAGLLLAFVPFEDRPLETWALAFLKSIYSPTIYLYKKRSQKNWLELENLKSKITADDSDNSEEPVLPIKDTRRVNEFIQSLPSVKRETETFKPKAEIKQNKINPQPEALTKTEPLEEKKDAIKTDADWRDTKANLNLKTEKLEATGSAVFGSIPMPDIPDTPNIIVGMATDETGKIVEGVIIEIQDEHGNPSRVLKTNQLGQFRTSAALANGRYLIICEKDGYKFDRVNVDLNGEIVKPIRIIASN